MACYKSYRWLSFWIFFTSGCTYVHHAQVGDIDNTRPGRKIEVNLAEIGIDLEASAQLLDSVSRSQQGKKEKGAFQEIAEIISLFQMGPQTGNPVYNATYADRLRQKLIAKCPHGNITNILSIRELNDYGVASGEIVTLKADCLPL